MKPKLHAVDRIIDGYGTDREALIQILLDIQKAYRWLPRPALERTSERLGVPMAHIYNLATFYKHFSLVPQGRHSVHVCVGTACHVRGAEKLVERASQTLGIRPGETSPDERFSLNTVSCLGCCALGPVMVVDGEYKSNPTARELEKIVEACE